MNTCTNIVLKDASETQPSSISELSHESYDNLIVIARSFYFDAEYTIKDSAEKQQSSAYIALLADPDSLKLYPLFVTKHKAYLANDLYTDQQILKMYNQKSAFKNTDTIDLLKQGKLGYIEIKPNTLG